YPHAFLTLSHYVPVLLRTVPLHHLAPHSFPTRRSSDLSPARGDRLARSRAGGHADRGTRPCPAGGSDGAGRGHEGHLRSRRRLGDRKSTRLNSSHEWISYAVFCLKKKKQNKPHPSGHST